MPTVKPRFCITVDEKTLEEIDDFRFSNRYKSRSLAAFDLILLGLDALKKDKNIINILESKKEKKK